MDHALSQLVVTPTRGTNILDLFITNFPSLVTSVSTIPGISDHEIVSVQSAIYSPVLKQIPRRILCYSKANWEAISADLEDLQATFSDINLCYENTETLWATFRDKLISLIDLYIPTRNCRNHRDLPWLTPMLRRKI